jgi:P-type Ca2+ transporter type 2C
MTFHSNTIAELLEQLKTNISVGLTYESALHRLTEFGANKIASATSRQWWKILFAQFNNLLVLLLMVASALSFQLGSHRDGIVLALIVMLNAFIGFYQDWKSENILASLKSLVAEKCTVVRNGKTQEMPVEDIVPGDLLLLHEGDGIAADMRLIESHSLFVNEFILTGESQASEKDHRTTVHEKASIVERSNMVFMGTSVAKGEAKGVVVGTGMQTELGKIARKSQQIVQDISPLQKEINLVAKKITIITLLLGAMLFGFSVAQGEQMGVALVFAIGVAAAVVPEGLPAQISIALSLGVRRLAQKKAVVKQLSSVEALGSATVIASDKTGTITKNEMSINNCLFNGQAFTVTATGYAPEGQILDHLLQPLGEAELDKNKFFLTAGILSSTSSVHPPDAFHPTWYGIGDPTECAFCTLAMKSGYELRALESEFPRLQLFPFDSERKRVSVIRGDKNKAISYVKGSIESILDVCNQQIVHGKIKPLTDEGKQALLENSELFAAESLRVIAIAYKELDKKEKYSIAESESNLVFAGFVTMFDPPRDEVPQAIQDAFNAHIRIIVITGDNEITTRAIANNIGLVNEDKSLPEVINQAKLATMTDADIKKALFQKTLIFSRVSPDDKLKIVSLLKEMGEVVAVTGDGVNDTLSLKKADIGVAMGQNGSKVAQEAAAMVLLNDDFSTIVKAIKEGRTIFNNIRKNVVATLASNTAELVCVLYGFMGIYFHQPVAILAIHILLIDLIAEMIPLLILTFDEAEDGIMTAYPRQKGQLLNRSLLIQVLSSGILRGGLAIIVFNSVFYAHTGEAAQHAIGLTSTFTTIVLTQFINIFCIRTKDSVFGAFLFSNPPLIWAMLLSLSLLFVLIYTPFFNLYLHTAPLTLRDWGFPLAASLVYLVGFEGIKWVKRYLFGSSLSDVENHAFR